MKILITVILIILLGFRNTTPFSLAGMRHKGAIAGDPLPLIWDFLFGPEVNAANLLTQGWCDFWHLDGPGLTQPVKGTRVTTNNYGTVSGFSQGFNAISSHSYCLDSGL